MRRHFESHTKQLTVTELKRRLNRESNDIMIKSWLHQILEHGTVPALALASAIALTNSVSRQRQQLTDPTKHGTGMVSSTLKIATTTSSAKDYEPVIASAKPGLSANRTVNGER